MHAIILIQLMFSLILATLLIVDGVYGLIKRTPESTLRKWLKITFGTLVLVAGVWAYVIGIDLTWSPHVSHFV